MALPSHLRSMARRFLDWSLRPLSLKLIPLREWPDGFSKATLSHYIGEVNVIVDVGANEGQSTQRFLRDFPEATIYAFEPDRNAFQRLSGSFGNHDRVTLYNEAVSSIDGNVPFVESSSSVLSHISKPLMETTGYKVSCRRLDKWAAEQSVGQISLLKIDTEGHDLVVVEGASDLVKRGDVSAIVVEFGSRPGKIQMHECVSVLDGHGFAVVMAFDVVLYRGTVHHGNLLFVHKQFFDKFRS